MSPSEALARDRRADEAVSGLAARGDHVAVVRLVEAWFAAGNPSLAARLHEARAFFHLRLMDRALVRAREVADQAPDKPEALRLLAEIYLERGWPTRALKPLETLRGQGQTGLDELWARAQEEQPRAELNAREIERAGDLQALLSLAESFIATGSFLRATGILERLRRQHPEQARIKDLLWGLAGDFATPDTSFDALLESLAPPPIFRPVLPLAGVDEPEHTENVRISAGEDAEEEEAVGRAFPTLFKGGGAKTPFDDDGDVTQASALLAESVGRVISEATDPGYGGDDRSGDTQILLVLKPGESADAPPADTTAPIPKVVNLRDWKEAQARPASSPSELESEDENVILVARSDAPLPEAPIRFAAPIEVIEKHAIPDPSAFEDEAPTTIARRPPPDPALPPPRRATWPWLLVALLLVAMLGLMVLAFNQVQKNAVVSTVRAELGAALATDDEATLLAARRRFDALGDRPAAVAARAELDLVLAADFGGGGTEAARALLAAHADLDPHRLAMLRAAAALADGDSGGAAAAIAGQSLEDDEERRLAARIYLSRGDTVSAGHALADLEDPESPRSRRVRGEASLAAGKLTDALAELSLAPGTPHLALARLEAEGGTLTPDRRLAALRSQREAWAGEAIPARVRGDLAVLEIRATRELDPSAAVGPLIAAGLAADPAHPELHLLSGAELAAEGQLRAALAEVEGVLGLRPADPIARRAAALLLLDLDRRDELQALLPRLQPSDAVLVTGLVAAEDAAMPPEATEQEALDRVALQLRAHPDPFVSRFAARSAAAAAAAAGRAEFAAWLKTVRDEGAGDAPTHLRVAAVLLAQGNRVGAANHLERAARIGPEYARVHEARARFYTGGQAKKAAEAWEAYLALAPTGPRAVQARSLASR